MYTEIAISNGPGILLVHVVVPDECANWIGPAVEDESWKLGSKLIYDSEPVSRERFLEWAQTA